jgi:GTP pyrophosphokinase
MSLDDVLTRARAFAEPFLAGESLDTGENMLVHAERWLPFWTP